MTAWDAILKKSGFSPRAPYRAVVETTVLLKRKNAGRILDLGCGAGRHLVYLSSLGFEVCGLDISRVGLEESHKRLKEAKLEAELMNGDMAALPYSDSCFDAVISISVIYHNTLAEMRKTISEIHRILEKNGVVLLTFQTKQDRKFGIGKKLEDDAFIPEDGPEKGVVHHFSNRVEVQELLKDFHMLNINLDERVVEGKLRSKWEALAEK